METYHHNMKIRKKLLKNVLSVSLLLLLSGTAWSQKVNYKSGVINVDGTDIGKVVKIKDSENFGLTSTFELYAMGGQKLAIAVVTTEFAENKDDNMDYYYRLSFLTTNQTGIFLISKLGPEKSFAKLIGASGIIVNDQLDAAKVTEFIARKGKSPSVKIHYDLVKRDGMFPVFVRPEQSIFQGPTLIGKFKDVSDRQDADSYEFSLPEGLKVAKVTFTGGNNATKFIITTYKDNLTLTYTIPTNGTYGKISSPIDRNEFTLQRLARWLVQNNYL